MTKPKDVVYAFVGNLEKSYDDAGVLHVRGLATDASLDLDGQRCDPAWLKSAMPAWMEWGNIREMHGASAVGTASSIEQSGTGYILDAAIVDPLAAKKVEAGVYKGFSIGIKGYGLDTSTKALELAPNGIINKGEIIEISVVDRPANPNARLEVAKMVGGELTKVAADVAAEVQSTEGTVCVTCGGFGVVKNEGGTTEDMHTCPDCNGTGSAQGDGGVNIRPSDYSGDQDNGEVADDQKSAKGDPDCETCAGKGTIKDGHVDCPDCVQGKSAELTDYLGFAPENSDKSVLAEIVKKDFSDKERKRMASTGEAMPGGGFPINSVSSLKDAIQSIGRAKNPAAAKAHIKRRAKALGREDLIPDTWKSPLPEMVKMFKAASEDSYVHDPAQLASVRDGIVTCIEAELAELLDGENEIWDLGDLFSVLSGFLAWWQHESNGGETAPPFKGDDMDFVSLGVSADLVKAAGLETATDADRDALRGELVKALKIDEMIASVTAASEEIGKKVTDFAADLEMVKSMAAPRGIALRATQEQRARAAQRETLLSEAKSVRSSANLFTDPHTRSEFLSKAASLEAQANLIQESEE